MTTKPTVRPPDAMQHPEVRRLILRWREHGDRAARDTLFDCYFPLARRLAGRYRNPHEPQEDLVQVAAAGLLGAIDRFDPDRDIAFAAFVIPTVLGELKRYFRTTGWSAHVPRRAQELAQRVRGASRVISENGRSATVPEIAEYLEISLEDVVLGLGAADAHYSASLDAPASAPTDRDDALTLGDGIGNEDEGYDLIDTKLSMSAALRRIPHLERTALRLRNDGNLRQRDIAELMGCSQMQVSRLLRRAARQMRELTDPDVAESG